MATKFADFMLGLEEETGANGSEAVAQLEVLRSHFRIGRRIAQERLRQRLSQAVVARRAQVDQREVSRIERGLADPTLATLRAVACALGLEVVLKRRPG
jgi:ribosome-binding protein aMBF1 (putative translation factor)